MGRHQASRVPDRLTVDAGAIIALASGDVHARAFIERLLIDEVVVVVPTPVLAQSHRGGRDHARIDRALKWVDQFVPTSERTARDAGVLLARSGLPDAITSDLSDMAELVEAGGGQSRVSVLGL